MKKVRITERILKNIIKESVINFLNENTDWSLDTPEDVKNQQMDDDFNSMYPSKGSKEYDSNVMYGTYGNKSQDFNDDFDGIYNIPTGEGELSMRAQMTDDEFNNEYPNDGSEYFYRGKDDIDYGSKPLGFSDAGKRKTNALGDRYFGK